MEVMAARFSVFSDMFLREGKHHEFAKMLGRGHGSHWHREPVRSPESPGV